MPLRLAIRCILPLVLITAAFAEAAFAQDIVTDCDRYAASRLDPQRKAAGVEIGQNRFCSGRSCLWGRGAAISGRHAPSLPARAGI